MKPSVGIVGAGEPPGHLRAASSGSERFIRTAHGCDVRDTESALEARRRHAFKHGPAIAGLMAGLLA